MRYVAFLILGVLAASHAAAQVGDRLGLYAVAVLASPLNPAPEFAERTAPGFSAGLTYLPLGGPNARLRPQLDVGVTQRATSYDRMASEDEEDRFTDRRTYANATALARLSHPGRRASPYLVVGPQADLWLSGGPRSLLGGLSLSGVAGLGVESEALLPIPVAAEARVIRDLSSKSSGGGLYQTVLEIRFTARPF